jgi:voltage-gated potassium channel
MGRYKKRAYEILEKVNPEDKIAEAANIFLTALIVLNAAAVVLESVDSIYNQHRLFFKWFGSFSIAVFAVEYFLRLWSSDVDKRYQNPILGRIKFALTPLMIIDLMVILPYYLPMIFPDLRFLRAARILWIFRLLKIGRYSESLRTLENVIRSQKEELLLSFAAIFFFLVISCSIVYFLEHSAQPEAFPNIPETMWWGILTMTTIGPTVYPVTPLGKVIGGLIIILGVATFALPTGILTSGFVDEIERKREEKRSEEQTEALQGDPSEER